MNQTLIMVVQMQLSLALFYLGYRFLLRPLTFYTYNRWYFLLTTLYSLIAPILLHNRSIVPQITVPANNLVLYLPVIQEKQFDYSWLQIFYGLIVAGLLLKVVWSVLQIQKIKKTASVYDWENIRFWHSDQIEGAFSFWNDIFCNLQKHEIKDLPAILTHEAIHVEKKHTLDVLLFEILSVIFWFNPAVWLLKRGVKENIEYQTDSLVVGSGQDKKQYQMQLLYVAMGQNSIPLSNSFNVQELKHRISMMNKKSSSSKDLRRYFLLAPILLTSLTAFTVTQTTKGSEQIIEKTTSAIDDYLQEHAQAVKVENLKAEKLPLVQLSEVVVVGMPYKGDSVKTKEKGILVTIKLTGMGNAKIDSSTKFIAAKDMLLVKNEDNVFTVMNDSTSRINMRATSPMNAPLCIVNGKEVSYGTGGLTGIDPSTIESISVLKDKHATEAYGEKGRNGVIIVTLKK
ncbi:M56 family metallopeptidase [Flectobacillus sp. DC10W]|uniref:M56 family metallopeptidase n=1 Tax=Flectobacillus longus TaxID=2984207 RepID=A0ABT6YS01_9BACT|nr:M56 family metallopeptidase [Flectobacillus longus]MDI9866372.1 M56 family metallopeptidase [Flectobacillus longus]